MLEEENNIKRKSVEESIKLYDFFVVVDFRKFRNVIFREEEDEDGEKDICAVIPLTRNGIKSYGRDVGRAIFGARKSKEGTFYSSHYLQPIISTGMFKKMKNMGIGRMYNNYKPIIGLIVKDVMSLPHAPKLSYDINSKFFPDWLRIMIKKKCKIKNDTNDNKEEITIPSNNLNADKEIKKEKSYFDELDIYGLREEILNMAKDDK